MRGQRLKGRLPRMFFAEEDSTAVARNQPPLFSPTLKNIKTANTSSKTWINRVFTFMFIGSLYSIDLCCAAAAPYNGRNT